MATLEVHDGRGRVEFVTISREHPALFGSDPKCDVVLNDPSILPFHGRLRWKGDRFKAEAFPESKSLDLNGQKIVSASFRKGDEISVGRFRIFLVSDEDGAADIEKTRVQARPAAGDNLDWVRESEIEPPSMEAAGGARAATRALRQAGRGAATARAATTAPAPAGVAPASAPPPGGRSFKVAWWKRIIRKVNGGTLPPGREDLSKSPLILALAVALGTLLLFSYALWNIFAENRARNQFMAANQAFEEFDFKAAMKGFEEYLATNPGHSDADKARVLNELANVRQFTAQGGVSWTAAIEAARKMIKDVGQEPYFLQDRRMDLAAEIMKAAEGFADQAKARSDPKALADAQDAIALHEKVAAQAHKTLLNKSSFPKKLEAAQAAVTKAQIRADALAKMEASIKAGKADDVFAARNALVLQYPDLKDDKDVVARLAGANDLIRKAVSFDPTTRPADTTTPADPLGPPVSQVLRSGPAPAPGQPALADGPLVYALVQGSIYGLDGASGMPIWQVAVGMSSPFAPIAVAGAKPSVLVFDSRRDELVRLDGRTGALIWRQSLGEPINAPPLVLGNQVVQVIPSGKLLVIDVASGELKGALDVGRPLAGTPAADEAGQFFYLTGDRDNVYVVSRDPLECVSVAYLGHPPGSIRCAPARLANFLIVAENRDLWEGRWSVFVIEQQGTELRYVQSVPIPGWTWQTPQSQGTILWSMTDRNGITAFAMGPEDSKAPLTQVAANVPDTRPSGTAYAVARGDREIWISGSRLGRFDLRPESGSLSPSWTIERAGQAVAPIQQAARLAVFTHQFDEGPGVMLWGIDPSNGRVAWKTVLGAPWPVPPSPAADGQRLTTLSMKGPEVSIAREQLQSGAFIEQPLRQPGFFYLPDGPLRRLEKDGLTVLVPAPDADHLLVREGTTAEFRRVDLPAPLGAPPVFWGPDLFVPGLDGRAYLVNPKTGAAEAEPYVPTFDAAKPTRWRAPVFLADAVILADESGKVRRLQRLTEPRLRLDVEGEVVDLNSPLASDPAATRDAVIVATEDGRARALAGRDLSSLGAVTLDVPRAFGPVSIGENAYIVDKGGGVLAFGPEGNRAWGADLRDSPPVGPPVVVGDAVWFLSRDGVLQKRSLADGSQIDRLDLGILPIGGLTAIGQDVVVSASPGTIRILKPAEGTAGGAP